MCIATRWKERDIYHLDLLKQITVNAKKSINIRIKEHLTNKTNGVRLHIDSAKIQSFTTKTFAIKYDTRNRLPLTSHQNKKEEK